VINAAALPVPGRWRSLQSGSACRRITRDACKFVTEVDGLDIEFIHVKSRHEDALPLIITSGWPGSVIEMLEAVSPLTDLAAHGGRAERTRSASCRCPPATASRQS
jgi:Epoxide hydrolase N terminus